MANSIEYAKRFVPIIDRLYKNGSYTSGLDSKTDIDFTGVNEVKILKISTTGLGDYSRTNGYPKGDITVAWETITLEEERGKELSIDRMDNEETLGTAFGEVTSTFMNQFVNPELDAYRFSKYASTNGIFTATGTLTAETVMNAFDEAILALDNAEVPQEGRVFYVNTNLRPIVSAGITRRWGSDRAINTVLDNYNGIPIVYVVPTRFYDKITLNSGATEFGYKKTAHTYKKTTDSAPVTGKSYYTQEGDGSYKKVENPTTPATNNYYEIETLGGVDINFMLIHTPDVMQAVKFAMPKVFTPDENQEKDMWKFQLRIYHDAYIYDNKKVGVYCHKKAE